MLQEILKTAMIGTEKYLPTASSALMQEVTQKINSTKEDKEDFFLKLTAAYLLLQEAGREIPLNNYQLAPAPPDSSPLISVAAAALIKQLLQAKEVALLNYSLYRTAGSGKVLRHELLPPLLQLASTQKDNQRLLQVCGDRGRWLARLNESWQGLYAPAEAEVWETGTLPQRREYLSALRKTDPQKARELLAETLPKESAGTRLELMELMQEGLSLQDEAFLESQCKDKSQKVKQLAYKLLKLIPESKISQQYADFLKQITEVREDREQIMGRKKMLDVKVAYPFPEALAESGLEKVSSQKGVDDIDYWLAQILEYLSPDFWQQNWDINPDELILLFVRKQQKALFLQALFNAAFHFKHQGMAHALLRSREVPGPQILALLPLQERYAYAEQFLQDQLNASLLLAALIDEHYTPIPAPICRAMLQLFSQQPYALTQAQYQQWALYLPAQLLPELQEWARKEALEYQQRYFKTATTEMCRILETKEQLNASL